MIGFLHPWALAGLAAVAIPLLLHLLARREPPTVIFPAVRYLITTTREHQRRLKLQHLLLLLLRTLLLAALILAAAGPRIGGDTVEVKQEGIAIVITIDISSSMLAEDFAPSNRLAVAQRQAVAFIRGRSADRIGLVAFAGEALTQVPVTLDYPVIEQAVMDLKIGSLEDGTAIGSGLATAVNRLRRAPDKSKVVLLLTDGENNRGLIDPRTAAATAAAYGIKVYTIGVGTIGEAPIPTGRGLGGFRYELLPVRIDEPLLREIASKTGGRYFRARDSEALSRIFRQIDELEKSPIQVTRYTKYEEATRPLILLGLAALALELVLGSTLVVRVP
jgi:Ca-activated chloride channel family protein